VPEPLIHMLATTDAVGGVWTYALDLARALLPHGVVTTLAVLGPPLSAPQRAAASEIAGLRLVETGAELDWLAADEAAVAAAAGTIAALAAQSGAHLVQLNSPVLADLAAWPVPLLGVCHSCLATWWAAVQHGPMPADFRWRSTLLARGYAACDMLVAPTAAFADDTARIYGLRPMVVHNGAAPIEAPSSGLRPRCVLTGGRLWDEGKNFETLDLAASLLDAPLLAAGPLVAPHGTMVTAHHSTALGQLSPVALRAQMERAPIFASLSIYEPFGLTVLEAAQSGCALVLSDIPTFRELWEEAAIFVPAPQADAAASALQNLLDDPGELARLGAAAQARASRYTADAMAESMYALYRHLVPHRAAA
jgi:glycogen(starch) synthase